MLSRTIIIALVTAQMIVAPIAWASPKIKVIKKGEPAPFSGFLLNNDAQAKIRADKEKQKELCSLRYNYFKMRQTKECEINLNIFKIRLDAELKRRLAVEKIKNEEIKKLREIALKKNGNTTLLWVGAGVLVGILVTIGTFFLVSEARKVGE